MKFPENDVMIYGDLAFDSFDELLDFSVDEEEEAAAQLFLSDPLPCPSWDETLLHRPPPPPPPPQHPDHGSLPCDDIDVAQLEWLSQFVEESFLPAPAPAVELPLKRQYRTPSPVSVLQHPAGYLSPASSCSPTSSSCSGTRPALLPEPAARGPRTKRARPSAPPLPFSAAGDETCVPAPEDDRGEAAERSRKKAKKPRPPGAEAPAAAATAAPAPAEEAGGGRRCMHCDVQKTPQWRAGPMGPKTLCNACGVRYKSGRLFPEYRPAASPTFSVSLHSNSHKKVVEMRNKAGTGADEEGSARPVALKGCELLNYIRTPGGGAAGSGRA